MDNSDLVQSFGQVGEWQGKFAVLLHYYKKGLMILNRRLVALGACISPCLPPVDERSYLYFKAYVTPDAALAVLCLLKHRVPMPYT